MSQEKNKELARRLIERGIQDMKTNPAAAQEYFAPHYKEHTSSHHERNDLEGLQDLMSDVHEASPDLQMKVLHQAAEGDLVFTHWQATGTHEKAHQKHRTLKYAKPSGQEEQVSGVSVQRFQNDKIVEAWSYDTTHEIGLKGQGATSNA